jgi:hypothetical protein
LSSKAKTEKAFAIAKKKHKVPCHSFLKKQGNVPNNAIANNAFARHQAAVTDILRPINSFFRYLPNILAQKMHLIG